MRSAIFWTLVFAMTASGCNLLLGNNEHSVGDAAADLVDSATAIDGGADADAAAQEASSGDGPGATALGMGADCKSTSECATGLSCADGVCCNQACGGSCESCNLPMFKGTCTSVPQGQASAAGHAGCSAATMASCGKDGKCDGQGGCELWPNGTVCGPGVCSSSTNTLVGGSVCDGKGACTSSTSVTCTPFMCAPGGTACAKTCATSADCVGQPCMNNSCGTVANGSACSLGSQCTSGSCVDGFCCNSACTGSCQACDVAAAEGVCTPVPSGRPHGTRAACPGTGACQGSCSGSASCTFSTGSCAAQSCSNGTLTPASSCNGAGACSAPATSACSGGLGCNGSSCYASCTSDGQCASGTPYCNTGTGSCQATAPLGHACSSAGQCASGLCCGSVCVDPTVSGNCGSCGTTCATGGSCTNRSCTCPTGQITCSGSCMNCGYGACGSGHTCAQWTVASSISPDVMVTDGVWVVWFDHSAGAILQKSVSGSGATTSLLADPSFKNQQLGVDSFPMSIANEKVAVAIGSSVYVLTVNTPTTTAAALQSFNIPNVSTSLNNVALNGAATHVALMNATANGYELYDCVVGTSTCTDVGTFGGVGVPPWGNASNSTTEYFVDNPGSAVRAFSFGTGIYNNLVAGQNGLGNAGVAIDTTYAYWSEGTSIVRTPLLFGGTPSTVASVPGTGTFVDSIATDGKNVYVTTSGSGSPPVVAYAPVTGTGAALTAIGGQAAPTDVVTGGGMVFWIDKSNIFGIAAP